jgi:hypothetical protein
MGAENVTEADFQTEEGRWSLFHNNVLTHPAFLCKLWYDFIQKYIFCSLK